MRILSLVAVLACVTGTFASTPAHAQSPHAGLPKASVPDSLGVNIHFTDGRPGEVEQIAAGGFRIVRMDLFWNRTEKVKGEYDFSGYDRLVASLEKHRIRPLFILDYGNPLYDDGNAPHTDEARAAFVAWAKSATQRYRGRNVIWEIWNEPNLDKFWKPKSNVADYTKLVKQTAQAIREVAPGEPIIGPAASKVDLPFLEACFKAGLLEVWDAVSVHPYRGRTNPETVASDYRALRALIARYAPAGKAIPILSAEWGYTSVEHHMSVEQQGKFLARQWLTNFANDIPLSIWYDWRNDGLGVKEAEHHFGTVLHPFKGEGGVAFEPKPAYFAAKTLTTALAGHAYNKRLACGGEDDYVLLFTNGESTRLAVWTAGTSKTITIPVSAGRFAVMQHLGEAAAPLTADARGLTVTLTDSPQYLVPEARNDLLRIAAAWKKLPLELRGSAPERVGFTDTFTNPLDKPLRVIPVGVTGAKVIELKPGQSTAVQRSATLSRTHEVLPLPVAWDVAGVGRLQQATRLVAENPLIVTPLPSGTDALALRVENPGGQALRGGLQLVETSGLGLKTPRATIEFATGERERIIKLPLVRPAQPIQKFDVVLSESNGAQSLRIPAQIVQQISMADVKAWRIIADGDSKVASQQSISSALPAEGAAAPGLDALRVEYSFEPGWKFVRIVPSTGQLATHGEPRSLRMWIYGDGQGNIVRPRIVDSTGQTFQPHGQRVTWKGWRLVEFPLDGTGGYWGGADDGIFHGAGRVDTLLLIDKAPSPRGTTPPATSGTIYISGPTLGP